MINRHFKPRFLYEAFEGEKLLVDCIYEVQSENENTVRILNEYTGGVIDINRTEWEELKTNKPSDLVWAKLSKI